MTQSVSPWLRLAVAAAFLAVILAGSIAVASAAGLDDPPPSGPRGEDLYPETPPTGTTEPTR